MHSTRGSAGASGATKKCCKQVVGQKRDPLIFTTVAAIAIFALVRAKFVFQ